MFEEEGISFVAEDRHLHHLEGLRIDVQEWYGREGIVAYNARLQGGGGC